MNDFEIFLIISSIIMTITLIFREKILKLIDDDIARTKKSIKKRKERIRQC